MAAGMPAVRDGGPPSYAIAKTLLTTAQLPKTAFA
jgi:hypothetical protein